jgi:hypothetical protein
MADNDLPDAPWSAPQAAPAQDKGLEDAPWAAPKRVTVTPGQAKYAEDEALTAKYRGAIPDTVKTAGWAGGNAAFMYLPRAAAAGYESFVEDKPYKEALKEQTEYEEALYRQNPKTATGSTIAGTVAGLAVPLGPVAKLGQAAGAATAARLGTTAGKVAEGATTGSILSGVSGIAATADPATALKDAAIGAGVGGAAAPVLGALGNYFTKLPAVRDASGNLTREAELAIDTAFKGKMNDADIASFKTELIAAFEKKGISPEVAREALLTKEGITPTASLTTGRTAPKAASDIGELAAAEGAETLAKKAETLAGTAPASGEVARLVHGAETKAHEAGSQAYEKLNQYPEIFKPEAQDLFPIAIQKQLFGTGMGDFPTTHPELLTAGLNKAAEAYKLIDQGIGAGNFLIKDPATGVAQFNFANMNATRKALNQLEREASGADRTAVLRVKAGFDSALNDAVAKNLFTGSSQALVDLRKADALWNQYKSTFYDRTGLSAGTFKKSLNAMLDSQINKMPTNLSGTAADTAQGILTTGLLNKSYGSELYDRMARALQNDPKALATVKSEMRNNILQNPSDLKAFSTNIDKFLTDHGGPNGLARKIFDKPGELADLRRMSEAAKVINAKPVSKPEKDAFLAKAVGKIVSLGIGAATYPFHGGLGAIAGYAGSELAGAAKGAVAGALARRAEAAGAPKAYRKAPESMRVFDQAPDTGSLVRNIPALGGVGVPGYQEPTTLPPLTIRRAPIARASGGRVAAKLVSEVERAKKAVNNRTKVLLNADDSHVARALEIANQNLEG